MISSFRNHKGESKAQAWGRWSLFCALLTLQVAKTTASSDVKKSSQDSMKKAHFTFEFIPSVASAEELDECQSTEVKTIQDFLAKVIHEDTGFSHNHSHRRSFLDDHYNAGRNPGFDLTFECPETCEAFPTDWCQLLCEDDFTHLGHEPLVDIADDLKYRLHHTTKNGHDHMFAVECLGDLDKVDLHLEVGKSPYVEKRGWIDRRKSKRRSEL